MLLYSRIFGSGNTQEVSDTVLFSQLIVSLLSAVLPSAVTTNLVPT